ncbi:shikimate kinase [Flavobacteriaceae bacterium]|nr:shikimate kinase [Flavobacteriaceae bacterium]
MKILLLGYMGSGKSVVGKQLSKALQYSFVDLDIAIEEDQNLSLKQLFETKGELYFRSKERLVLNTILEGSENVVLALGGGTPCYGDLMQKLTQTSGVITIYLGAEIDTLTNRLYSQLQTRPLISHISDKKVLNDFIRKHLFERSFYYQQAHHKIMVDQKPVQQIVEEIVALLF